MVSARPRLHRYGATSHLYSFSRSVLQSVSLHELASHWGCNFVTEVCSASSSSSSADQERPRFIASQASPTQQTGSMASDEVEEQRDLVRLLDAVQISSPAQLMAHETEQHPREFSEMPAEIRNRIYEQVILESGTFGLGSLSEPELAQSSHSIARECGNLFYELRRFPLTVAKLRTRQTCPWILTCPEDRIQAMRRFVICDSFKVRTHYVGEVILYIAIDLQKYPDAPKVWLAKQWFTVVPQPLHKYWEEVFRSNAQGLTSILEELQKLFEDMAENAAIRHFTRENLLQIAALFLNRHRERD